MDLNKILHVTVNDITSCKQKKSKEGKKEVICKCLLVFIFRAILKM